MRRYHITLGSLTTVGGTVVSASSHGSIDGIKIALEDDEVACPNCRSAGKIFCVGPRIPETWNGKQVALENDLCICGCSPPPKLMPRQKLRFQVMEESPTFKAEKSGEVLATIASAAPVIDCKADKLECEEIIEQFFSLLDENGQPAEGYRYDLYIEGAVHKRASAFIDGHTVKIVGGGNTKLVTWFNTDGASHHV